ncbi:hypothetical protein F4775DRAFT_245735 [Biscogniauxia sp. FL1348]|nr:hypothetical protein F4775DRAFT_245735 [Biscogniauxia sp. FL1348]
MCRTYLTIYLVAAPRLGWQVGRLACLQRLASVVANRQPSIGMRRGVVVVVVFVFVVVVVAVVAIDATSQHTVCDFTVSTTGLSDSRTYLQSQRISRTRACKPLTDPGRSAASIVWCSAPRGSWILCYMRHRHISDEGQLTKQRQLMLAAYVPLPLPRHA